MAFDQHKNFAISAVATAPSPATSGASLVVTTGHGVRFPTPPFNAIVWPNGAIPDPTNSEVVRVTALATDTLTIARAQEGSAARTIVVGDLIVVAVTAKNLQDIEAGYVQLAAKTANYTATLADEVLLVSAASGAVTITLPAAATALGKRYTVKKTDVGTNAVTIDGNGSETIDGALTMAIINQYDALTVVCDGSAWLVV